MSSNSNLSKQDSDTSRPSLTSADSRQGSSRKPAKNDDINEEIKLNIPFPEPFPLSSNSPFHISRLKGKAARCIRAKYTAYQTPSTDVQQSVIQCIARNMQQADKEKQARDKIIAEKLILKQKKQECSVYGSGKGPHEAAARIGQVQKTVENYHRQQIKNILDSQTTAIDYIRIKAALDSDFSAVPFYSIAENPIRALQKLEKSEHVKLLNSTSGTSRQSRAQQSKDAAKLLILVS